MALVVFAWLTNQQYFKDLSNIETLQRLRDKKSEEVEEDLLPFGFFDRNTSSPLPLTRDFLKQDYWFQGPKTIGPKQDYSPYVFNASDDEGVEFLPNF